MLAGGSMYAIAVEELIKKDDSAIVLPFDFLLVAVDARHVCSFWYCELCFFWDCPHPCGFNGYLHDTVKKPKNESAERC
jgi:hypothetical protein